MLLAVPKQKHRIVFPWYYGPEETLIGSQVSRTNGRRTDLIAKAEETIARLSGRRVLAHQKGGHD